MPSTAFRELSLTSWREIVRDPLVLSLSVLFPLCFVGLFAFLPDVVPAPGVAAVDGLTFGLPSVLLFALMSLGLTGTAAPLTVHRQRGVLRTIACAPVGRWVFVSSLLPARAVVAVVEVLVIAGVTAAVGALRVENPLLLAWAVLLAFLLMMALGYFLGGLSSSPELAGAAFGMLAPIALMLSGIMIPLSVLPDAVDRVARLLPFTYLGDLLRHALTGLPLQFSVLRSSSVLLATVAVLTVLTLRTFRWDDGER